MGYPSSKSVFEKIKNRVFFRPGDAKKLGLTFQNIQQLLKNRDVEKISRGLYRVSNAEPTEMETIAMVAAAAPKTIVCLLSALRVHDIGTQLPHTVWIALNRKSRKPALLPSQVRIVRYSGPMLKYGVSQRTMMGVKVFVTSPARTVVDCFRYRQKIGLAVALEALRDAIHSRKTSVDEIMRTAKVCRISTVISPYVEALSS
ncbi:MAG: type IV toxin-antitoxin system AbiEi family antitoxin domain-containing protein [Elusimicrobia bacterium]|nr:type IV toxin-antitoxin system AbiEi family antitoxin domain-containing protein [Elusimicrobiota bacterium]